MARRWYEVWDARTRNLIDDTDTEQEAQDLVRDLNDPWLYILLVVEDDDGQESVSPVVRNG